MKDLTLSCEITLTGLRFYRLRLILAKPLLRLAALVIGCGIEIRTPE